MTDTIGERVVVVESAKPMDELCADLERSIAKHEFGLLHVHDVTATMAKKGVPFEREVKIFDVCNPHQAKRVMEADIRISSVLPCAISVFREGERTRMAFVRPTVMLDLLGSPELRPIAEEVEQSVTRIVERAAE